MPPARLSMESEDQSLNGDKNLIHNYENFIKKL